MPHKNTINKFTQLFNTSKVPIQVLKSRMLKEKGVEVSVLRDDLNHPLVSGNKLRKVKYNLLEALEDGYQRLITFGGAFSNHIHAVSAVGQLFGIETIGIIRGERPKNLNSTLRDAMRFGMKLHFISRNEYRRKHDEEFQQSLLKKFGQAYILPEGGSNVLAVKGVQELGESIKEQYNFITVCAGTGGTSAGLASSINGDAHLLIFPALKGGEFLHANIDSLLENSNSKPRVPFTFIGNYHFGGYAKWNFDLVQFINESAIHFSLPLDPIYTGKMMFGLFDLIRKGYFKKGTSILAIHTGGLQGIRGFNERFGELIWHQGSNRL